MVVRRRLQAVRRRCYLPGVCSPSLDSSSSDASNAVKASSASVLQQEEPAAGSHTLRLGNRSDAEDVPDEMAGSPKIDHTRQCARCNRWPVENKSENENVRLFYPSDPPAEKRRGPGRGPVSDPMRLGGGLESSGSFAGQNGEWRDQMKLGAC